MIYRLRGILIHKEAGFAVVECAGVGYKCLTTAHTLSNLPACGQETKLYTHMSIRENDLDLFGFSDERELSCFRMLISITGVGPRMALSILSTLSPDQLALAVVSGDIKALTACSGVGKKTAERIILELRDKLSNEDLKQGIQSGDHTVHLAQASGNMQEAVNALLVLGYSRSEAAKALSGLPEDLSIEELIRRGLKALASA